MTIQYDNLNTTISAVGSATNIPINIQPKGTGGLNLLGSGQNLILYSQDFSQSPVLQNVTVTNDTSVAPDNTTTADTLTSTVNGGSNTCWVDRSASPIVQNVTYAYSVYLKQGTSPTTAVNLWFSGGTYVEAYSLVTWSATPTLTVSSGTGIITSIGNGWFRITVTQNSGNNTGVNCRVYVRSNGTSNVIGDSVIAWGRQLELASTPGIYVATTTTVVYGTPTLTLSGVAGVGLQSDGSLYVQPAGTGAIQAQPTTSTATGGNARGQNAVDWQTVRSAATHVASGYASVLGGGSGSRSAGYISSLLGGIGCNAAGSYSSAIGGLEVQSTAAFSTAGGGFRNNATGPYNFIGGGYGNTGTANAAVTTQATTTVTNGSTAVTLSASNANIKVGQLINAVSGIGNYPNETYVAAISGTSLTLSQAATATGTPTLTFFTPHGVVVGGGNNQATGSYSFIGGGGDAGTAANRNVASGDWSFVGGGWKNTASGLFGGALSGTNNTASGIASVVCGGGSFGSITQVSGNTASGLASFVGSGFSNVSSSNGSFVGAGAVNTSNGIYSAVVAGNNGTTRSIWGNHVIPALNPFSSPQGSAQSATLVLGVQTTDATATALTGTGGAASTTNQVILPNNSAYFFRGEVISGVTGGGNTKGWFIEGVIKRGANAASTALVGTPTVTSNYADAGASTWTIAVTADTTNGGLAVTFTGQASTTIRTVAQIRTTEMTY